MVNTVMSTHAGNLMLSRDFNRSITQIPQFTSYTKHHFVTEMSTCLLQIGAMCDICLMRCEICLFKDGNVTVLYL